MVVQDEDRAGPDDDQRRGAADEFAEHLVGRGEPDVADSQIVDIGGAVVEAMRLFGFARERFYRRHTGHPLLQLAGKFLEGFLQVVARFLNPRGSMRITAT